MRSVRCNVKMDASMDLNLMYRSPAGAVAIAESYRRLLLRWPPSFQPVRIATSLGETFAMRGGMENRPAVLMLHGSGSNGVVWMGASMELGRIARTYVLDIPGEPGNSAAVRCGWGEMINWLGEVRRQVPERPLVLLGNSLGGWLAMASAATNPAGVAAVMTIGPAGICPRRSSYKWYALAARWAGKRGPRILERSNLRGQAMDDEFREFFDLASRHFLYRPSVPQLSDEELRRLTMPFGYWAGGKDILLPTKKIAGRLRRLVPQASIFIDRKGGHGFHPPASVLREWLAGTLSKKNL
jgi:pimeloyl-ACP methyl ester carboxylesterase